MTKLFIVYIESRHKTYYMSMNTIIQINSSFDILIYTQRSLYVKRYSSCIHNFRTTYYYIIRHLSTRRYIYFIHHIYTAFDIDTLFTLFDIYVLFCRTPRMFLMKLNVCYSTLFDILLLHLISFIVSFCYYLSNKEAYCHILPLPLVCRMT